MDFKELSLSTLIQKNYFSSVIPQNILVYTDSIFPLNVLYHTSLYSQIGPFQDVKPKYTLRKDLKYINNKD